MPTLRLIPLLVLALTVRAHPDPASFDLAVDDPTRSAEPWPVLAPLPFARGALADPSRIRLTSADGSEVPAQFDVAARYRDGSLRWVHASFTAAHPGPYRVTFGEAVRREEAPPGLRIETLAGGARRIDTGAARFTLRPDALLFDRVELRDGDGFRTVAQNTGGGAYLVDNRGRLARAAGPDAAMETAVLREGPRRTVIRTEGWYVTETGERVARGILRMTFAADSAAVQATHTLVFTEDTNQTWIRDYGLELSLAGGGAESVLFAADRGRPPRERRLAPGETAFLLQETFPHFADRASRFRIGAGPEDAVETLHEGEAAGEWMDAVGEGFGITIVVPDLAEQFPKELEARPHLLRVGLWPARCGRELDFRAETLVRDYWKEWADLAPGGAAAAARWASNAQGAAKTHAVAWIFRSVPDRGGVDDAAQRAARGVRLIPDTAWATATRAIGWPLHPLDEERFPGEEARIRDFWERTVLPLEVFPMNGVIGWGSHPYLGYSWRNGRWFARHYRLSRLIDYGMKRYAWALYLRSGDRRYHDYGRRFNRFAADWSQFNWDGGPDRIRGAFIAADTHRPLYWHGGSELLSTGNSGFDIQHWLLDYYLTGDERSLEAARLFGEAVLRHWNLDTAAGGASPFMLLRVLTSLYAMDWDEAFGRMAGDLLQAIIDMDRPHPFVLSSPLYKVERNAMALYDYHTATGDPLARAALIRAMEYQDRFNRLTGPVSYQNGLAYLFTVLWEWTGEDRYLAAIRRLMDEHAKIESVSLADERAELSIPLADSDQMGRMRRGPHLNMHALLGMPTALSTPAPDRDDLPPFPVLMKTETVEPAMVVFHKEGEDPVTMRFYYRTLRPGDVRPRILAFRPDGTTGDAIEADLDIERRMDYHSGYQYSHFHAAIRVPAETPPGLYAIDTGGAEEMVVLESSAREVALFCPDGFWAPGHGWMWNLQRGIASGLPMFFRVPDGLEELDLFLGRPFTVRRPDGSIAIDADEDRIGEVRIPVHGASGFWSVTGLHPGNVKLRNVVPLVAMGTPHRYPSLPVTAAPRPAAAPAAEPYGAFAETDRGPALWLGGGRRLRFERGATHPDGGWRHFPGNEGTIEFWFLPALPDNERALPARGTHTAAFVSSGAVDVQHRYGPGPRENLLYGYLDLRLRGLLGPAARTEPADAVGTQARHFFADGAWVHVAATWRLHDGARGTEGEFRVFINGVPFRPTWNWPAPLTGRALFRLQEAAEHIVLGPAEGAMRDLKISAAVRYEEPFTPDPATPLPDSDTRALFPFAGDTRDITGPQPSLVAEPF